MPDGVPREAIGSASAVPRDLTERWALRRWIGQRLPGPPMFSVSSVVALGGVAMSGPDDGLLLIIRPPRPPAGVGAFGSPCPGHLFSPPTAIQAGQAEP